MPFFPLRVSSLRLASFPCAPRFQTVRAVTLGLAAAGALAGCNPDIFDVSVSLAHESYPIDFGNATGTIPTTPCSGADATVCGTSQSATLDNNAGQVSVTFACDSAKNLCYAQANATAAATVDVLQDDSFTSAVGRRAVSAVRMLDVQYSFPTNTTTFTIPEIDVYVGPAGSKAPTDSGVVMVDKISPIAAGTTFTDPHHLTVADGSPARDLIETSVRNEKPFVFVVSAAPRLEAGTTVPAGKVVVDVQPILGLGLR